MATAVLDPQAAAGGFLPAAGRRRRRLSGARLATATTRALFWIAGASEHHMRGRRRERAHFQLIGFSVVLTAASSVVGMVLFLRLSVPGEWSRDIGIALFWGLLIFWLDRWLVSRLVSGPLDASNDGSEPKGLGTWVGYVGRGVLGLLLAVTISGPIVLALFEPEVRAQVAVNQLAAQQVAALEAATAPDLQRRREELAGRVAQAERQEDAATAAREQAQRDVDDEISGRGGTGVAGCARECEQKQVVLSSAQEAEAAARTATAEARSAEVTGDAQIDREIAAAQSVTSLGIADSTGVLAREEALFDVLLASPVLWFRWAAISGLLILVDLLPILLKLVSSGRNSQMLHDRNVRLDLADDAAAADLERGTDRMKVEADHEVLRQGIRERKKLEMETDALQREQERLRARQDFQWRELESTLRAELRMQQLRLDHNLRLAKLRGAHTRAHADAVAQYGEEAIAGEAPGSRPPILGRASPRAELVHDRWRIDRPLVDADRGGAGIVFVAFDDREPNSDDKFVVKLLRGGPEHSAQRRRAERQLQNEQLLASKVRSDYVAPIVEAGTDESYGPYVVTPYYPSTLSRTLRSEFTPTLEWALRIAEQVLRGLVDCYRNAGLVHLDIKPANIALDREGNVHLLDLGLCRVLSTAANVPTGQPEASWWYAAPEQLLGADRSWVSSACDVRAVFAVLYEVVTGWPPLYREAVEAGLVDPDTAEEYPAAHRDGRLWALMTERLPAPPSDLVPGLPIAVSDLIMQGLAIDPAERTPGNRGIAVQHALDALTAVRQQVRRWDFNAVGRATATPPSYGGTDGWAATPPESVGTPPRRPERRAVRGSATAVEGDAPHETPEEGRP